MITILIVYWLISYITLAILATVMGKIDGLSTKDKTIAYFALLLLAGVIFPIFLMELFDRFTSD